MKFIIEIPDEDVIATSVQIGFPVDFSGQLPSESQAIDILQTYFDKPYGQVKKEKIKKEDPEVLAQETKVKQETQTYIDLVAQKSGVAVEITKP